MKKWLWRILAIVVILIVAAVVGVVLFINHLAKAGIEIGASSTLGVPTKVQAVNIGLFSGRASLDNLDVGNPEGFKAPHFFALGHGAVQVSIGSLLGDTVEIPYLELSGIDVNLEKNKDGKANYNVILDNMKKDQQPTKEPADKQAKPGKKFVIKELVIKNVKVHAQAPLIGAPVTVDVDEVRLTNVGTGGKTGMGEIATVVVQATLASALAKGGNLLPKDIAGDLGKGLEGLQSLAAQGVQVAGELGKQIGNIGNLGGEAAKALEGVGKGAESAVKGIGDGLGNLFGGDKKDEKKK